MKNTSSFLLRIFLAIVLCFSLSACNGNEPETDIWADAIYAEDTELGQGKKTVLVEVIAEDKTVTFTIHSDKEILGDALTEHGLIEGEKGAYGLYVKKVNGITADWNTDHTYWAFYEKDAYAMTGVDATTIQEGVLYALVRTAG